MTTPTSSRATAERGAWSPWRSVVAFGLVSLSADMVYEGMRSVAGPFLATLGASALLVGLLTGAGEALALVLRLVAGPVADRTGRYWTLTTAGYALTALCVPLLALTPFLGGAGLAVAAVLVLLERTGKAVRSPAKSALLAAMARPVGRGRGFAVHKALDQVGAFLGPLVVAGMLLWTGFTWPGFAVLAVPGVVSLVLLAQLRRRAPMAQAPGGRSTATPPSPTRLPRRFYLVAAAVAASTFGLMTFGIISFHLVDAGLVRLALVPVVYAGAMAVEAVAALATGWAYDQVGARVLLALPPVVAVVPLLSFAPTLGLALVGILAWGLATGVQDSTVKALVADLVPAERLATAYGVFAAFQGVAALGGGAVAGATYVDHRGLLVGVVGVLQVAALAAWVHLLRRSQG